MILNSVLRPAPMPDEAEIVERLRELAGAIASGNHVPMLQISRELLVLSQTVCTALVLRRHPRVTRSLIADGYCSESRPFAPSAELAGVVRYFRVHGLTVDAFINGQPQFGDARVELIGSHPLNGLSILSKSDPMTIVDIEASEPFWIARSLCWDSNTKFEFVFDRASHRTINAGFTRLPDSAAQILIDFSALHDWSKRISALTEFTSSTNPVNRWDALAVLAEHADASVDAILASFATSDVSWLAAYAASAREAAGGVRKP